MTQQTVQVQSGDYRRFLVEHPGVFAPSDEARFAEAVAAGWTPDDLIAAARAYRRLVDAQDAEPMPAADWLATMTIVAPEDEPEPVTEAEAFSAGVRAVRAVQGISQAELASRAQLGTRTVAQVEAQPDEHQTRHANRLAIAAALGWSVVDLVDLGYRALGR